MCSAFFFSSSTAAAVADLTSRKMLSDCKENTQKTMANSKRMRWKKIKSSGYLKVLKVMHKRMNKVVPHFLFFFASSSSVFVLFVPLSVSVYFALLCFVCAIFFFCCFNGTTAVRNINTVPLEHIMIVKCAYQVCGLAMVVNGWTHCIYLQIAAHGEKFN